jgi:hypothetical protein
MAEIMLEVTQPVHDLDGSLLYGPGERHPAGSLPDDVPVRKVIVEGDPLFAAPAPVRPVQVAEPEPKAAAVPRGPGRPRKQETT